MRRKYIAPSTELIKTHTEHLLNQGSVVDQKGNNQACLGSDTESGGDVGENNTVWGDAKHNDIWTYWEE